MSVLPSPFILPAVRHVIFDLDGTLTDPFAGITGCLQHALQQMGVSPPDKFALRGYIGPPLRETLSTLLGTRDAERIELAVMHYRARYAETGLLENELYPGVPELLERLRLSGCTLYVATSKLQTVARRITKHFRIDESFEAVFGAHDDGRFDDKRELLCYLLEAASLDSGSCVMIGDRKYDVEAGRSNGCTTVGLTYGYGSLEELEGAGADFICDSPGAILNLPLFQSTAPQSLGTPG